MGCVRKLGFKFIDFYLTVCIHHSSTSPFLIPLPATSPPTRHLFPYPTPLPLLTLHLSPSSPFPLLSHSHSLLTRQTFRTSPQHASHSSSNHITWHYYFTFCIMFICYTSKFNSFTIARRRKERGKSCNYLERRLTFHGTNDAWRSKSGRWKSEQKFEKSFFEKKGV